MKTGWKIKPLGSVCTVVNGGTPKSGEQAFWDGEVNWLTPKEMGQMKSRRLADTSRKITQAGLTNSSARLVSAESVILSTRAPIGHLAINRVPMAFNQGCRGLVPGEQLDTDFLYFFLYANREKLNELGTGATFKELSTAALKSVSIPLPPLEEQRRIVAILDEAFEGLSRARANAAANLQSARELFEGYQEAELLNVRSGRKATLGSHIDLLAGHAFKSSGYINDDNAMRLLRGDNIIPGAVRWEGVKRWPTSDCKDYERFLLQSDDVLIAMDRTWIKAGIKYAVLTSADVPSLLVQRVARLRCRETLDMGFLAILIGSKLFEKHVQSIQTGLGVPHISPAQIKDFSFQLPDIATQRQIVGRLQEMRSSTARLSERYSSSVNDLDDLRQSLLQKAFAGELTVKEFS